LLEKFGSFRKTPYICSIKADDMKDKKHPIRIDSSTWEEAMADLDESEEEFKAGKCIPWEDVMEEIK
jgi:hypothetical protein